MWPSCLSSWLHAERGSPFTLRVGIYCAILTQEAVAERQPPAADPADLPIRKQLSSLDVSTKKSLVKRIPLTELSYCYGITRTSRSAASPSMQLVHRWPWLRALYCGPFVLEIRWAGRGGVIKDASARKDLAHYTHSLTIATGKRKAGHPRPQKPRSANYKIRPVHSPLGTRANTLTQERRCRRRTLSRGRAGHQKNLGSKCDFCGEGALPLPPLRETREKTKNVWRNMIAYNKKCRDSTRFFAERTVALPKGLMTLSMSIWLFWNPKYAFLQL